MKNYSFIYELIISIVFILLVLLFLNPFMLWMPNSLVYIMMAALVALFAFFASFVWMERARDERDELHKMVAGRIGYLAGVGVLVLGVIVEAINTHVDSWLVIALAVMVLAKLAGLIYGRARR